MKKTLALLLILFMCAGGYAQSLKSALHKAYNATVEVYTQLKPGGAWLGVGTGWMCNNNYTFVTAKHVTNGYDAGGFGLFKWSGVKLKLSDDTFVNVNSSQIHESAKYDISVITLDASQIKGHFQALNLSKVEPEVGDAICGVGFPLGYDQIEFDGHFTGMTFSQGCPFFLTNAVINPGHSGSAVVNYNGEVVGMVIAKEKRTESINYILPTFLIEDMIKSIK